jgi:deoxyhypusine synthase
MSDSIYDDFQPLDFAAVKTYELASRPSKVTVADFAEPIAEGDSLKDFLEKLPNILAVRSLREIAAQIRRARALNKPIVWGIGGHVVKTGLAPVIIDLMRRGFVTAITSNGSVLVHDTEIAIAGFTSEDVDATLGKGDFGAARETGEILNAAAKNAAKENLGLGEAMGRELKAQNPPNAESSLLCQAYEHKVPFTAHLAIGADIGHFHSSCDGAALGAATHTDFKLFCAIVKEMNEGGVYLNLGSAVVLPEIFLKAVTVVRNLGFPLKGLTTANFDFIQSYRPNTNVVRRPTADGAGRGFSITGHHELMIPLLAAQILCGEKEDK